MKHIYFTFSFILSISLLIAGCSKDETDELDKEPIPTHTPGNIPGLGETEGTSTGISFKLPDNIEISGKIWGGYTSSLRSKAGKEKALPSLSKTLFTRAENEYKINETIGSGICVTLYIILKNNGNRNTEILFPAGLIAKSLSGKYQNGVLLKKASTQLAAGSSKAIMLMMYCGNAERDASSADEEYQFTVVSNSSLIVELCDKLKNKRINFEEYDMKNLQELMDDANFNWENFDWESFHSSQYNDYTSFLQDILWKLTDYGEVISDGEINDINNMEKSK